jgi:hypothetical protein
VQNYIEPPISSKYKPLKFTSPADTKEGQTKMYMTYGNQDVLFTDHRDSLDKLDQKSFDSILLDSAKNNQVLQKTYSPYLAFKTMVDNSYVPKDQREVSYTEIIYPRERRTYLSGTRKRLTFHNDFWRDKRVDRTEDDFINSSGLLIQAASIWRLDAHKDFATTASFIPTHGDMAFEEAAGELQNAYCLWHWEPDGVSLDSLPSASVNYNRRIPYISIQEWLTTGDSPHVPSYFSLAFRSVDDPLLTYTSLEDLPAGGQYLVYSAAAGDVLWEANVGSKPINAGGMLPFYDSYDDYAEDGFRMMKDGGILPEFRISERIPRYQDEDDACLGSGPSTYGITNFFDLVNKPQLGIQNGILSLTGSAISSGSIRDFLNDHVFADFYKHFSIIKKDYSGPVMQLPSSQQNSKIIWVQPPAEIALGVEGLMKFLPYDGFYPAARTRQLGALFSSSLILGADDPQGTSGSIRSVIQPYYAPGIMFNSIKSGIGVDYPIINEDGYKGVYIDDNFANDPYIEAFAFWPWSLDSGSFTDRIPFEAIMDPLGTTYYDAEPDPNAALDSTASIKSCAAEYKYAAHNFLASTMDFFLKDGRPSVIASADFPDDVIAFKDDTYTMDIVLKNSENITNFDKFCEVTASIDPALGSASVTANEFSITMYSRAITGYRIDPFLYGSSFGPPCLAGIIPQSRDEVYASFEPFTPPYYDGYSLCRLTATFSDPAATTTLKEVLSDIGYTSARAPTLLSAEVLSFPLRDLLPLAQEAGMQVTASIDCGNDAATSWVFSRPVPNSQGTQLINKLIISPKFECPILDFSNASATPSIITGNVAHGMWHQYGEVPAANKGIKMELHSPQNAPSTKTNKSMVELLNFGNHDDKVISRKLGQLRGSNEQKLSEAICIIPFKTKGKLTAGTFDTIVYKMNQFESKRTREELFYNSTGKSLLSSLKGEDPQNPTPIGKFVGYEFDIPEYAPATYNKKIYNLFKNMRKYVVPPHLDFLHNKKQAPFVMYILEFEKGLSQNDLQNIWQNLEPTFGRQAQKVVTNMISHNIPLNQNQRNAMHQAKYAPNVENSPNLYWGNSSNDIFDENTTRWAVFKIKKRARNNYYNIVNRFVDNDGWAYTRADSLPWRLNDFAYSYNWPHDFYSLIELSKITTDITFNPIYGESNPDDGG